MMKMKAKTNNRASKIIVAVALALALIAALVVTSYAWLRNNVAIDSVNVKTGAMLYKITLYHKDKDGNLVKYNGANSKLLYDTGTTANKQDSLTVPISDQNSKVSVKPGEELFFVIEKRDNSIDLDVAVSFEPGLETAQQYDYMGQVDFEMKDISDSFKPSSSDSSVIDAAIKALSVTTDTNNVKSMNAIWSTTQKTASLCSEGETPARKFACVRVAFSLNSKAATPGVSDQEFPLKVKFCVAQKGALPGEESGKTWNVSTAAELKAFMDGYDFNDTLYITKDIKGEDIGDLVFTRPCKIILNRATLQVNGNLIFSYAYDGQFSLDTRSDGHINVLKSGNDAAGIFKIDLPNAKIDLIGANNAAAGKADVYVEGEFEINASNDDDKGISFDRFRVCDVNESLKTIKILDTVKISTANRTQLGEIVAIAKTDGFGYSVMIDNRGSIDRINLMDMTQDATLLRTPGIFIDNGGTIGKISGGVAADDSDVILLPNWSQKFVHKTNNTDDTADDTYVGNTRIFANKGSSEMKAITQNFITVENDVVSINWPEDSTGTNAEYFSSNRSIKALRDDIEYDVRTVFVEFEKGKNGEILKDGEGNPTNVIIHYEEPSSEALSSVPELEALTGKSLRDYVKYYDIFGDKTAANYDAAFDANGYQTKFLSLKVICYGEKVLSADDYAFIRTMKSLTTLDLADAASETQTVSIKDQAHLNDLLKESHKLVPEGAFENMTNLSTVIMSESDTAWSPNIFKGTNVKAVTFPQALTRLLNPRDDKGKVSSQSVLTGVKYVYASITSVEGIWANAGCTQYFFVPDEFTYNSYRNLNSAVDWRARVFLNNGMLEHPDIEGLFLRYDSEPEKDEDRICEFVVYTGESGAWLDALKASCGFDFAQIAIGSGDPYKIVSYDPFALYQKLKNEPAPKDIVFGADLKWIGEYAFAENSNIKSVEFLADTKLLGHTFYKNASLEKVTALKITSLSETELDDNEHNYALVEDQGYNFAKNYNLKTFNMPMLSEVNGGYELSDCPNVERVDISIIKKDTKNEKFYVYKDGNISYSKFKYARFYIHTENAATREDISYTQALAADYRYIFVNYTYADLYRSTTNYVGVAELGDENFGAFNISDIKVSADGSYYYYTDDKLDGEGNLVRGTKACIVACLDESIDESQSPEYILVSSFVDGGTTYTVTKIGSAAYYFTKIRAKVLTIPQDVKEIGNYAFSAEKYDKQIGTFNLADVKKAGQGTFYAVNMLSIVGEKLEQVGFKALTNNEILAYAYLPNLSVGSATSDSSNRVFSGAKQLRVAYTSFSKYIAYDTKYSGRNSYVRFINAPKVADGSISPVNTIVNAEFTPKSFSRNIKVTSPTDTNKSDYKNVYFSDYYDYSVNFPGGEGEESMTVSVSLPGYVFYEEKNGDLTLFAVSPDIEKTGEYVTPNVLYIDSADQNKNSVNDNGSKTTKKVTTIGKNAYGVVTFSSLTNTVTIGSNVKTIEAEAFNGTSYIESNNTNVVLSGITTLNLSNVESVGAKAFYKGGFKYLNANKLKTIGKEAFSNCKSLGYGETVVLLPAFEVAEEENTFNTCTSLSQITFGENARTFVNNMFNGATALTKITILNGDTPVGFPEGVSISAAKIAPSSKPHVYVPASVYDAYKDTYFKSGGTFGGVQLNESKPDSNYFHKYGQSTKVDDIVYYWEKVGNDAYIDHIEISGNKKSIVIPSVFDTTYNVISIKSTAMSALSGVEEVTLPANMKYITFTAADLADSITTLIIGNADNGYNNGTFKTVDGVLYSADGKTLYVYPKAKADESFVVGSDVTQIFDEAFSGVKSLKQLTINSVVTVNDRAFAKSVALEKIIFTNATASIFAGREILNDANVNLYIYVPSGKLDAYKANVLIDYSILGKILANS